MDIISTKSFKKYIIALENCPLWIDIWKRWFIVFIYIAIVTIPWLPPPALRQGHGFCIICVLPTSNWLFTNPNGPDLWSWHGARSRLLTPGFSSDNLVFEPFLISGKFWSPGHLCERRHQPPHRITTILFWRYIRRIFLTLSLQHYNLMF